MGLILVNELKCTLVLVLVNYKNTTLHHTLIPPLLILTDRMLILLRYLVLEYFCSML